MIDANTYWQNEIFAVKKHLENKALNLWEHDNGKNEKRKKNQSASNNRQVGFSTMGNMKRYTIEDRVFWIAYDNTIGQAIFSNWIDTALKSLSKTKEERHVYEILNNIHKHEPNQSGLLFSNNLGDRCTVFFQKN